MGSFRTSFWGNGFRTRPQSSRRGRAALGKSAFIEALEPRLLLTDPVVVISPGPGNSPELRITDVNGNTVDTILAFAPEFLGGARVATGDVNGDGTEDIIVGAGTGGGPHIRVFDGTNPQNVLREFFAFDPGFRGGVFVATADFNQDGQSDIIVSADAGGGPHVKVFDGADLQVLFSFFAYDPGFTGGVRVAAGLIDGDGVPDIVTGPGPGGGPHVRVFTGLVSQGTVPAQFDDILGSFFAYDPAFLGGVYVAVGDLVGNSSNQENIITGPGIGGGPHVRVFQGLNAEVRATSEVQTVFDFFVENPEKELPIMSGLRVGTTNINGDSTDDLIVATEEHVFVYEVVREIESSGGGGSRIGGRSQPASTGERNLKIVIEPVSSFSEPNLFAFVTGINLPTSSGTLSLIETPEDSIVASLEPASLSEADDVDAAFTDEELLGELLESGL